MRAETSGSICQHPVLAQDLPICYARFMIRVLILTATIALSLPGCAAIAAGGVAGAGTVAYLTGELNSTVDSPLDPAIAAARAALEELRFTDIELRSDALKGRLSARDADRAAISVSLDKFTSSTTQVRIRVGILGNERVSREILSRIEDHLERADSRREQEASRW